MVEDNKKNIYNALQNLYNMDFKTWQEVLAMLYNLVADIEQKFEVFESKFEITLGKEVTLSIKQMVEDGSLGDLINMTLLKDILNNLDELTIALNNKANVNSIFSMANMGQDVKEAMSGGSVAVVGKNSVLEENIIDGQVTKRKTSFYKKSMNLENRDLQINGKGISNITGEIYDNPDLTIVEEFIPITAKYLSLEKFNNNGESNGVNESMLIAFHSDTNFLSANDLNVNSYIPVPSKTTKIRYQIMNNLKESSFNLLPIQELQGKYIEPFIFTENEKINSEIEQLKNGTLLDDESITPIKTSFFDTYRNLFNTEKVVVGAILKDNGIFDTSFSEWRATEYIKVRKGTSIYFSNDGKPFTTHLGALYNKDKKYLSGIQDAKKVIIVEDGFMRVAQNGGFPEKYQIEENRVSEYKDFNSPKAILKPKHLDIKTKKPYEDKSYLTIGDSILRLGITDSGWLKYFSEIVKPSKIVNVSVNGATWKDYSDTPSYDGNPTPNNNLNVIGNQIQKVINEKANGNSDYENFDVIMICAGTNDHFDRFTETIETVENEFITSYATGNYTVKPIDKVNRKTFAGAMRYAYEKLYEIYPNAVFFITTPLQEAYENYLDIKAKGDLMDYIADRLSINTINSRRCGILNTYESPVNDIDYDNPTGSESMRKRDLSDGIHPNPSGGKKLGEYNARGIIQYYCF